MDELTRVLITGLPFVALGALLGAIIMRLWHRRRQTELESQLSLISAQLNTEEALAAERATALARAEERLGAAFARLASESLSQNSEAFLRLAQENLSRHQERATVHLAERQKAVTDLIRPVQEALEKTHRQLGEIEKARHESFGSIRTQLAAMSVGQQALQTETRNLVNALRRPQVRGQWGEMTLRRVVELAGMVEHCDFVEQPTVSDGELTMRPDMIVRLPERGELVLDVKTPLDAYLEAAEAATEQERKTALQRHARNVMDHVRALAGKAYWSQFAASPEFVILFMPGEQFLAAALSENPGLLEEALRRKVLLATPTSLVALLKAIAYGWRELSLAQNAEEVRRLAEEIYDRLGPFTGHLSKLGRQLDSSVKAFNEAVGSLERKVLPSARKLIELGIRTRQPLETPLDIETAPRELAAPEEAEAPGTTPGSADTADTDDLGRPH